MIDFKQAHEDLATLFVQGNKDEKAVKALERLQALLTQIRPEFRFNTKGAKTGRLSVEGNIVGEITIGELEFCQLREILPGPSDKESKAALEHFNALWPSAQAEYLKLEPEFQKQCRTRRQELRDLGFTYQEPQVVEVRVPSDDEVLGLLKNKRSVAEHYAQYYKDLNVTEITTTLEEFQKRHGTSDEDIAIMRSILKPDTEEAKNELFERLYNEGRRRAEQPTYGSPESVHSEGDC